MKSKNLKASRLFLISFIWKFLPPSRCHKLKAATLRWAGAVVGKNVEIMSSAKFLGDFELIIGDNVYIGHEALISGSAGSKITICDYAKVGSRCILVTGYHQFTPDGLCIEGEGLCDDITIGTGAALSTRSFVNPGKVIGKMSHVMAGSIVTHDVPDYVRVAGTPAKIVKKFLDDTAGEK